MTDKERGFPDAGLTKEEAVAVYDRLAPVYGVWGALFESRAADRSLELSLPEDATDEDVLEVGVGTGDFFGRLVDANPDGRNVGVDISRRMAERTRARMVRKSKNLDADWQVARADAFALPFDDDSFDLVVCQYVLDLIPADGFAPLLDELRRVLRYDGRLSTVTLAPSDGVLPRLLGFLHRLSPKLVGGCRPVPVKEILEDNGFRIRESETVRQLGLPSDVVVAVPYDYG